MGRTLWELTRLRLLLFLREPEVLFWVFAFPIIMALVLAFAFKDRGVEPSKIGVLASAPDAVRKALAASDELEVETYDDREVAEHALARGRIDVLVSPGAASEPPLVHLDENRTESVTARLRVRDALQAPLRSGPVTEERPVAAVGSRYIDFLFPGLLGMNIMGTGLWGIGFYLVDQRQKKLLRRMLVTPMPRAAYLLSFITSRFVLLAAEVLALLAFGLWMLDVPLDGSIVLFGLLTIFGAASFAGLGLLVASRARHIETISNLMNLVMMPMWLGSGVFFSYERFPEAMHPFCRALPLTALNDALRAVMLDGAGANDIAPELGVLLAWGVVCYAVALKVFRWE
ncbi:MAG: integral membrane transport protein [Planctomycetes bacterium]|nr:integral membrane transport protein [Planctomycetota bacterium]